MTHITLSVDDGLLRKALQYADERETTLEALILEHLAALADRAGRRLTLREQTYADYRPPEQVVERLRGEGDSRCQKTR
jgi:hypothetical protein